MTQPDHLFPWLKEGGVSPKRAHSVSYWKTLEHFSLAIHRGLWAENTMAQKPVSKPTEGKDVEKENFQSENSCPLSSRPSSPNLVTLHARPRQQFKLFLSSQVTGSWEDADLRGVKTG